MTNHLHQRDYTWHAVCLSVMQLGSLKSSVDPITTISNLHYENTYEFESNRSSRGPGVGNFVNCESRGSL